MDKRKIMKKILPLTLVLFVLFPCCCLDAVEPRNLLVLVQRLANLLSMSGLSACQRDVSCCCRRWYRHDAACAK